MNQDTSDLKATLRTDLTASIRSRDAVRSSTLRMALTAISNAEVAGKEHRELGDEEIRAVLAKEAKKRKEASIAFSGAGRTESARAEEAELKILQGYLPAQLDDAALDALAREAVEEAGATGMAQMGSVMKVVQPRVAGRAEGGRVAAAVKRALSA